MLESLTARLEVRLMAVHDGGERLLFAGTGRHAGLEIIGALDELLSQVGRPGLSPSRA